MQSRTLKCAYCLRKVSDSYIRCMECDSVNLCVTCFSAGAESGVHKKCHRYSIETINYSKSVGLFVSDDPWNFDEELRLTEAVETYGYGNWSEVALQVGGRTAVECKQHYERFYANGSLGSATILPKVLHTARTVDHTQTNDSEPMHDRMLDLRNDICNRLGYMPYRDEFEYEYCNDAEGIISRVPFGSTDPLEFELQLALVAIYNQHLIKRQLLHTVARSHGLLTRLTEQASLTPRQRRSQQLATAREPSSNNQTDYGRCLIPFNQNPKIDYTIDSQLNRPICVLPMDACPDIACIRTPPDSMLHSSATSVKHSNPENHLPLSHDLHCSKTCHWHFLENVTSRAHGSMPNGSTSIQLNGAESNGLYSTCTDPCLVIASTSASDSGICSSDSCAQSTISNGSTTGDSGICNGFVKNHIRIKRPRSNSDSVCVTALSHTPGLSGKLVNSCQPNHLRTPANTTEKTDAPPNTKATQWSNGMQLPDEQPVIKRRRGRPPRNPHSIPSQPANLHLFRKTQVYPQWMNPFLRYLTRDEARMLSWNLQREAKLRAECDLLTRFHHQGVRYMRDLPQAMPIIGFTEVVDTVERAARPSKPCIKRFSKLRSKSLAARVGQIRMRKRMLIGRALEKPVAFACRSSRFQKHGGPKMSRVRGSKAFRARRKQ